MHAEVPCLAVEEIDGSPRYVSAACLATVALSFSPQLLSLEASLATSSARP